jgi:ATP-dependent DNA helicase RecG
LGQIKRHANFINAPLNASITCEEDVIAPHGASLSELQRHIMEWIEANSAISYEQIAALSGKDKATVRRNIQKLKQSGHLERVGSRKTGEWKALK